MNAGMLVDRRLEAGHGDKVAIRCAGEQVTYAQLHERICAVGNTLSELVILITARAWTQGYEWSAHHPIALKAGAVSLSRSTCSFGAPNDICRFPKTVPATNFQMSVPLWRTLNQEQHRYDVVHLHSYHSVCGLGAAASA